MSEYYLIAEIKSLCGDDGFVSLMSYSDRPGRLRELKKVFIDIFGEKREFIPESFREVKSAASGRNAGGRKASDGLCVKFKNFNSSEDAQILLGRSVYVAAENLDELSDDTYFVHDLIGSEVRRNGARFGIIKDVLILPANDVYVIEDISGEEVLLPAIRDYVESFDAVGKILTLKPGDQIYDENAD